ncbi:hypothetical protein [Streptomyces sp. F-3]|uniref:Helix-turn-helix domain-containing protein n=1 Tax=Streptomyces thermogriseus TaxID=75292 RepID=A0ABN1T2M9_9ACTN|nr:MULTISPECIES: hypothetical protein [Streptomyces]MDN5385696.1 hypothetical protein [Streptomyces sp. LB8]GAT80731.1 hypothetical protein [Streptomyces sp. F-3]
MANVTSRSDVNTLAQLRARRAVRLAARQLTEDAPKLARASAAAYQAGLAARAAELHRAALIAWRAGIPAEVIAADGRLPQAVVHRWITGRRTPGRPCEKRP